MKQLIPLFLFCSLIYLQGCSDSAIVNIFDEKIAQKRVECMKLVVFPSDEKIESALKKLYTFDDSCTFILEVSKKSSIVCNSNQNSQTKAISGLPSAYLRMQISKNKKIFYSYYVDLESDVRDKDIKKAFDRIKKDLIF